MSGDDPPSGDELLDDEELEDGFEEGENPFVKADDKAYPALQAALEAQLRGELNRVTLELREKSEELKKLVQHREEIGVTLYGAQQQLAKLQISLESLHDKYATVHGKRLEDDEKLKHVQVAWEKKKEDVQASMKRLAKTQDELNQLNITLRQVEEYCEEMKAEIHVSRRAAYKAEDHIKSIEGAKSKQDLLIDRMNEDIKRMTEQKALLDAQLIAQKQETEAALATLRDASKEMEAIEFEKKQLMQQWRSSLVGIQRRDEALQNVQQALEEQREAELAVENEIRGLQNSIKSEQERNEQLSSLRDRNDREMQFLHSQMTGIKQDREKLMDTYNVLKRSMEGATDETTRLKASIAESNHQMEVIEKNIQGVSENSSRMLKKIDEETGEQTTCDRVAANSRKRAKKVAEEIAQKEVEIQTLHNEIARVTVDSLNTKAHNQMLKDRLKQLSEDLCERERLIEQYEQEIRKRNHQIGKKQLNVDRLNRVYDEKRTKLENEAGEADVVGPQEAKIKHMRKGIDDLKKECADMQKEWITKQTQLLAISADSDKLQSNLNDQKNRKMVLEQKKVRVEGQLEAQKKEIKELENAMKHLRFDMDRMSGAIMKHDTKSKELSNSNQMMETEFVAKLKEIESQCLDIEAQIASVKDEKNQRTADILESERQVLLWERKITLEREMQQALDPNVGQADAAAMKKEIHRMELRLQQLKRRQEGMIVEMERAIHKKDAITQKYEPMAKKNKSASTSANLKRQIQSLKNNLKLCTQANADAEQKISQRESDFTQLQRSIEQGSEEYNRLERTAEQMRGEVQVLSVRKQRNKWNLLKLQRTRQRYDELSTGTGPPPPGNIRSMFNEQLAIKNKIVDVVRVLHDAYPQPQLDPLWNELYEWLEVTTE
eukprot:TRINITY_DN74464_c0_g1_i1.p1 TRINITY_DN74464_c0_g1~~TRINITY_DN74464_c0_g1_i1.p1  ORF type:complete len:891 (-),score=278.40 TRINITY_DN74464_c0_g1_i1:224-2896(-)